MNIYFRSIVTGMFLALLFTLLVGCGSESSSIPENISQPVQPQPIEHIPIEIPTPPPNPECNRDLAGTCRHNQPTMGALEIT